MSAIAELLLESTFGSLWWFVLFPVIWLVAAPFILVIALFRGKRYRAAVFEMFLSVHHFWKEWGIAFTP